MEVSSRETFLRTQDMYNKQLEQKIPESLDLIICFDRLGRFCLICSNSWVHLLSRSQVSMSAKHTHSYILRDNLYVCQLALRQGLWVAVSQTRSFPSSLPGFYDCCKQSEREILLFMCLYIYVCPSRKALGWRVRVKDVRERETADLHTHTHTQT